MLEVQWPLTFLLLPLPWLVRRTMPAAHRRSAALKVSFLDRLQNIPGSLSATRQRARAPWLPVVIWILLVFAGSRPEWLGEPLSVPTSGRDMMLAVDLSGSMEYRDMQLEGQEVDRLAAVKHFLGDFIERRHGDRIGLILFGSNAYVQAPLTLDRNTVADWLDESFIGLAGRETAVGEAIGLAIKRLADQPADNRVVILITDGANTAGRLAPLQAARLAAEQQIKVFTIGVGAESTQAADAGLFDMSVDPSLDLDENTLKEIAHLTGARYFRAREAEDLADIYADMDALEPALHDGSPIRAAVPLYPWPLGLALLASLALVAWNGRRNGR